MVYNHIDDVKDKLVSGCDLEALPYAPSMLIAIKQMQNVLRKYYEKMQLLIVYGDAMILNPHVKVSIFKETWKHTNAKEYSCACRKRFIVLCSQCLVSQTTNCAIVIGRELLNKLGSMVESAACWSADADVGSVKGLSNLDVTEDSLMIECK